MGKVRLRTIRLVRFPEGGLSCLYIACENIKFIAELQIEYNIFNKTATRLAESMSVMFTPIQQYGFSWMLSKLGHQIDPKTVVENGSQYQHGES